MSKKTLVLIGAGGFAREVQWLVNEINQEKPTWELMGFIDDDPSKKDLLVNDVPILGGYEWFSGNTQRIEIAFAVGNPVGRKMMVERFYKDYHAFAPNLIHPSVKLSPFITMGSGNILCSSTLLTTNITMGNFNIINLHCTLGHDVIIKNYCTLAPAVNISGNSVVNEGCDLGTNSCIIQGKEIGEWSIIGAGSVVVKNIPPCCTAVGVPARPIKYHTEKGESL